VNGRWRRKKDVLPGHQVLGGQDLVEVVSGVDGPSGGLVVVLRRQFGPWIAPPHAANIAAARDDALGCAADTGEAGRCPSSAGTPRSAPRPQSPVGDEPDPAHRPDGPSDIQAFFVPRPGRGLHTFMSDTDKLAWPLATGGGCSQTDRAR